MASPSFGSPAHDGAEVRLPSSADEPFAMRDARSGVSVEVTLRGTKRVPREGSAEVGLFRDAIDGGGHLLVRRLEGGVEDFVLLPSKEHSASIRYELSLGPQVAGLRMISNVLELLDAGGAPRLRALRPYVVDAAGTRVDARLVIEDCAFDESPRAPWGRPVVDPGKRSCTLKVELDDVGLLYPLVVDPAWTLTESMTQVHLGFVQLEDGRLLGSGQPASEIFDPATETWAQAASTTHDDGPPLLLSDGRVLCVEKGVSPANSELYDPSNGTWTVSAAHLRPTGSDTRAVLLMDGRVLLTSNADAGTTSAQLFWPGTQVWTETGSMTVRKSDYELTRLEDGRVLVTGLNADPTDRSAEIYDPTSGEFSATGSMAVPTLAPMVARLTDGRVLVAGVDLTILGQLTPTVQIFDPTSETFTSIDPGPGRHQGTVLLESDGRVLFTGGVDSSDVVTGAVDWFDPATETWTSGPSLNVPRTSHDAFALTGGARIVVGGEGASGALTSAEILRFGEDTGASCTSPATCTSGFCVDAVCCSESCGEGANNDCLVCSAALGAPADGECAPAPNGSVCDGGVCDQGTCAGGTGGAGGATGGASGDGGTMTTDGQGGQSDAAADDSGCAIGPRRRSSGAGWFVAIAVASVLARRRSRAGVLLALGLGGCSLNSLDAGVSDGRAPDPVLHRTAEAVLPTSIEDPIRLSDPRSGVSIGVRLEGAKAPRAVELTAAGATYRSSSPLDGDVEVRFVPEGIEDLVTVTRATAPIRYELTLGSTVGGLRLVNETLEVLDGGGYPRLRAAPPSSIDARGVTRLARFGIEGCEYDDSPAAPWRRPLRPPGSRHCVLRVDADFTGAKLPVTIDPLWTTTGSMTNAHSGLTLTTLLDGDVLVVAGPTSELYSATAGVWAATGVPIYDHGSHTTSLLLDGRVLAAGGANLESLGPSPSELYDPTAGTWSLGGTMQFRTDRHAATTLLDGRVLVTGGYGGSGYMYQTQLYRPATNDWVVGPNLVEGRSYHQSTRMADGRVLITGGSNWSYGTAEAEIYDPTTNTFTQTGSMAYPRMTHMAALLPDGRLLVAGGAYIGSPNPKYAEIYDPTMGAWSTYGAMMGTRNWATMTPLLNGDLLVVGGYEQLDTAEVWSNSTLAWTQTASPSVPRVHHAAALLQDGRVLIAGGDAGSTAELYGQNDPLGEACSFSGACASGHCVDSVCCDDVCGDGDPNDCAACSVAAGASSDGVCQPLANGATCAGGICESGACIANEGGAGGAGAGGASTSGGNGPGAGGPSDGGVGPGGAADGGNAPADLTTDDGCTIARPSSGLSSFAALLVAGAAIARARRRAERSADRAQVDA